MYWLMGLLHCISFYNSSGFLCIEWFDSQTILQGEARKGSSKTHPTLPFQMLIISRIPNHQMRNRVILHFWESYMMMSMNLLCVEVRSRFFHIQFHVFQNINIYYIDMSVLLENILKRHYWETHVRLWRINHWAPGCFLWILQVVYFPVRHLCLCNKKKITQGLEDMNFIFSRQKKYFSHSLCSLVEYCFDTWK